MLYEKVADERKHFYFSKYENEKIGYYPFPHFHSSIEVFIVTSGEYFINVNGDERILRAGDIAFIDSFTPHTSGSTECQYCDTCAYSAKVLYLDNWFKLDCPEDYWPYNVAAEAPLTEKKLRDAIENGPYGRCVFHCDNDAVDHQMVQMTFENGVKACLTMTAFVTGYGRHSTYFGTAGVIDLDDEYVTLRKFGGEVTKYSLKKPQEGGHDHGGGDTGLISSLYEMLEGRAPVGTSLEVSVESHLMGIAAEQSRKAGGKLIYVH